MPFSEHSRQIRRSLAAGPVATLTTQLPPERQVDWRRLGGEFLSLLAEKKTGLLFTVDGIHSADRTELSQLTADVQHFIRDGLPIGLIFVGLPAAVSDLLNEGVATFLPGRTDRPACRGRQRSSTLPRGHVPAGRNQDP